MTDAEHGVLDELLARCRRDHEAWINGDGSGYALAERGTILGAVGTWSHGGDETLGRQLAVARNWSRGTGHVELVNGQVHGDVAWLVMIERAEVEFADRAGQHRWDLRVTEVFQRGSSGWERVHRHADPLVDRHDLTTLLGLLASDEA